MRSFLARFGSRGQAEERPTSLFRRKASVARLLRAENVALLALALAAYWQVGGSWWLFAILFFAPDLSFAAAVAGPLAGLVAYNIAHAAIIPGLLAVFGIVANWDLGVSLAVIWIAHLAFDRTVGYGLKYSLAKNDTHLDRI